MTESLGKKLVGALDSIVTLAMLLMLLLLLSVGCYAMWDSKQIYQKADVTQFTAYKPAEDNDVSFEELQEINPEVFGWLTIYGTNIDYPLLQTDNNDKYVNTDVFGEYSLSGALFLDYRNNRGFTDFNSIIYGHNMDQRLMFGDIISFTDSDFFNSHLYGNLFYEGKDHGIEIFAFLDIDAYDSDIYSPAIIAAEDRIDYINNLMYKSKLSRTNKFTADDHIVILSTCSDLLTNGRHILAGVITDETYANTFKEKTGSNGSESNIGGSLLNILSAYPLITIIIIILILLIIIKIGRKEGGQ